jgi:hypothetical protein
MNNQGLSTLYDTIQDISAKTCESVLKTKNVESISYATIISKNADSSYDVQIAGGTTIYHNLLNKCVTANLLVGDCVIVRYTQGNIGNGYISEKMGVDDRGSSGQVTSVDGLTGDVILDDVKYISQTLSSTQQLQARTNIGVINDKTYEYTQSTASTEWSIKHNLNKFPSVTVIDSSGGGVVGSVNYIDVDNLTITFSAAFSGKAYLN